jgi:hypothetical protein
VRVDNAEWVVYFRAIDRLILENEIHEQLPSQAH